MSEAAISPLLAHQAEQIEARVMESVFTASAEVACAVYTAVGQWLREHAMPRMGPVARMRTAVRLGIWSPRGRLGRVCIVPPGAWSGVTNHRQVVRLIVAAAARALVEVKYDPDVARVFSGSQMPKNLNIDPELVGRVCILLDLQADPES